MTEITVPERTITVTVPEFTVTIPGFQIVLPDEESSGIKGIRGQVSAVDSAADCDTSLATLSEIGANTFYCSAARSGRALYDTTLMPRYNNFDTFAYLVPRAHDVGIEVYPLICTAFVGLQQHPEWNAANNHAGFDRFWLDFEIEAARQFVANMAADILDRYDVDGILLDYIRYSSSYYRLETITHQSISDCVHRVFEQTRARGKVLAASVYNTVNNAKSAHQHWDEWLDGNYIDHVTPMAYDGPNFGDLKTYVIPAWKNTDNHWPEHIIPRLSTCYFNPIADKDPDVLLDQINLCYDEGAIGMTLYDILRLNGSQTLRQALADGGW